MTGYRKEQLLGMNLEQICKPDSVTVLQEELNAPAKGENQRFDIEIVHSSGKPVHAELAYNPIFSSRGVYQGGIVIARDITELTMLRQKFKDLLSRPAASAEDVVAICASCKNIKLTEEAWIPIEDHFSEIFFSHGICPECCEKLYPQFDFNQLTPKDKSS